MAELYIPKAPDITTPFQNIMKMGLQREGLDIEEKKQKRDEDRKREEAALKRKDSDYKNTQDFLFKKHEFLGVAGKGKNIEAITKAYNEYTGQNLQPNTAQYEQFDEWKKRWDKATRTKGVSQEIKNDLWQEGLSIFTIPEIKKAFTGLKEEEDTTAQTGFGKYLADRDIPMTVENIEKYKPAYLEDVKKEAEAKRAPEKAETIDTKEKRQWSNDARRALVTSMGGKIDAQGSFLFSAGTEQTGDIAMQLLGDYIDLSPNRAAIAAKKQAERILRELPDATKHEEGTEARDKETGLKFKVIDGEWIFIGE